MATYARFEINGRKSWGVAWDGRIEELQGGLFDDPKPSGRQFALEEVRLLAPCEPPKILAVGQNYVSHLGERKTPSRPEMFYKPISALQDPGGPIVLPNDAEDAHFEGELVLVIGKTVRNASREEALAAVFGVTCGNDVSERNWQRGAGKDVAVVACERLRYVCAGGSDDCYGIELFRSFADPTRVNGAIAQQQRTSDFIFDVPTVICFVSRYLTLTPGDLIYTGTPGNTRAMQRGRCGGGRDRRHRHAAEPGSGVQS